MGIIIKNKRNNLIIEIHGRRVIFKPLKQTRAGRKKHGN